MNLSEILGIIGGLSAVVAIIFSVKNGKRTDTQDIEARVTRDTKFSMKLDDIGDDTKEIKETVKSIQNDIKDHEGRIAKLEASYKAEHKRLDEIFGMVDLKKG